LIGIFMALTFSASALAEHFVLVKKWLATAAALMLAACVVLTEKQLSYWHDSETLFTHALTVAESDLAYCRLGAAYQQQNRLPEAMQQYILATKFAPESPIAYDDLGRLLDDEGKPEAAASYYRQAVRWNPRSAAVHDTLGIILVELGRLDEALGEFTAAAQLAPGDPHPPFTMGRILLQQGRDAEAVTRLRAALRLDPNNPQMLIFTASVLAADENPRGRDGAAALALATQAVQLTQGKEPAVLDAQAMAFAETGQFTAAELAEQQAIKSLQATGQTDDVPLMQKHLQSYQAHQPWRESFKKSDSAH
jgi:Flp pilus assembly protein TadD